jgi:hypothetical protein
MWFASLAFFSREEVEPAMLTGHLDLATIERSQVPPIFMRPMLEKRLRLYSKQGSRAKKTHVKEQFAT